MYTHNDQEFIGIGETARRLDRSQSWVRKYADDILQPRRIAGRRAYDARAVEALAASRGVK